MASDRNRYASGSPARVAVPRDVGLALAYMRRALAHPISVAELARFCEVPERTLQRHFVAFLGRPPLAHFRRLRFAAVRTALLASGDGTSITKIATNFGFAHLGSFAAEYRRLFGEKPSATLARAPALAREARASADRAVLHASLRREAPAIAVHRFSVEGGRFELKGFGRRSRNGLPGLWPATMALRFVLSARGWISERCRRPAYDMASLDGSCASPAAPCAC